MFVVDPGSSPSSADQLSRRTDYTCLSMSLSFVNLAVYRARVAGEVSVSSDVPAARYTDIISSSYRNNQQGPCIIPTRLVHHECS